MLSFKENIIPILSIVKNTGARKILDVGCAYGKYGLLIREQYLSDKTEVEITPIDDIQIDAVEYTKYFYDRPALEYIYNKVIKGSVFDIEDFSEYDLILLIDIVEHYSKEEIKQLLDRIDCKVLISTPKRVVMYKEHYYGDAHPHICQWTAEDFKGIDYSTDFSFIFIENEN